MAISPKLNATILQFLYHLKAYKLPFYDQFHIMYSLYKPPAFLVSILQVLYTFFPSTAEFFTHYFEASNIYQFHLLQWYL